jgi:hypothetical protein
MMDSFFAKGDYVTWKDVPDYLKPSLEKYGRGPFRIEEVASSPYIGLSTDKQALESVSWLVLSKDGRLVINEEGAPKEFSDCWFKPFFQ